MYYWVCGHHIWMFSWSLRTFWEALWDDLQNCPLKARMEETFICQLLSPFDQRLMPLAINYSTLPKCTVVNAKLTSTSEKSWGRREVQSCHTCPKFIKLSSEKFAAAVVGISGWKDLRWWQKIHRCCPFQSTLRTTHICLAFCYVWSFTESPSRWWPPTISAKT